MLRVSITIRTISKKKGPRSRVVYLRGRLSEPEPVHLVKDISGNHECIKRYFILVGNILILTNKIAHNKRLSPPAKTPVNQAL